MVFRQIALASSMKNQVDHDKPEESKRGNKAQLTHEPMG